MAEAIMLKKLNDAGLRKKVHVDSAGTHASQPGSKPDPRASKIIKAKGGSISGLRSRKVHAEDFDRFQFILVMDTTNLEDLLAICPDTHKHKISLFLDHSDEISREVPDPFFGSISGFKNIADLLDQACSDFIIRHLQKP